MNFVEFLLQTPLLQVGDGLVALPLAVPARSGGGTGYLAAVTCLIAILLKVVLVARLRQHPMIAANERFSFDEAARIERFALPSTFPPKN